MQHVMSNSLVFLALVVACEDSPPMQFGSFEKVKAAALERGCVERIGTEQINKIDPKLSEYFECERVVGPPCGCLITFSIERNLERTGRPEEPGSDRGISHLKFRNEYCPRGTAGAIAFDLLAAAFPERYHKPLAIALAAPPVKLERDTKVHGYQRLGGVDLYTVWRPVTLKEGGQPVAAEQAEELLVNLRPLGLSGGGYEPAEVVPGHSSRKGLVCPRVDLEKRREQRDAERPVSPIELPFQGPVVR